MPGLISIQKPHTDLIFDFSKEVEWRKSSLPWQLYYVYESKSYGGVGAVIGEFEVYSNYLLDLAKAKDVPDLISAGRVSIEYLRAYAHGKSLVANFLRSVKKYSRPIPLNKFKYPCTRKQNCCGCKYAVLTELPFGSMEVGCYPVVSKPPQNWCNVAPLVELNQQITFNRPNSTVTGKVVSIDGDAVSVLISNVSSSNPLVFALEFVDIGRVKKYNILDIV